LLLFKKIFYYEDEKIELHAFDDRQPMLVCDEKIRNILNEYANSHAFKVYIPQPANITITIRNAKDMFDNEYAIEAAILNCFGEPQKIDEIDNNDVVY
jgi:hypothetical protein